MDTVTHGIAGSVLARGLTDRHAARAALILGLVAGMLPDLDLFFLDGKIAYLRGHRGWSHSFLLLPFLALALALLARVLYRYARHIRVGMLWVFAAIGILSHIVWDLFTHDERWGVEALPVLDEQWGPILGFTWLQHGSSALGLAILAVWAVLWLRRREPANVRRALPDAVRWAWWLSLPVALLVAWAIGLAAYGPLTGEWRVEHVAYRVLPPACAVWGLLAVVLAVLVRFARSRSEQVRR